MKDKQIYLRFVEKEDLKDLYKWRNDKVTRKSSFNTKKIRKEDHIKWFNESIANPKKHIFIIMDEKNAKVGQIRFDRKGKAADISISIAPSYRRKGYGTTAIKKGCGLYFNNFDVSHIMAEVKKENLSSIRAFETSGFKKHKEHKDHIELRCCRNGQI